MTIAAAVAGTSVAKAQLTARGNSNNISSERHYCSTYNDTLDLAYDEYGLFTKG